jgi:hypothetical protein
VNNAVETVEEGYIGHLWLFYFTCPYGIVTKHELHIQSVGGVGSEFAADMVNLQDPGCMWNGSCRDRSTGRKLSVIYASVVRTS